jgi:hypothetical protein
MGKIKDWNFLAGFMVTYSLKKLKENSIQQERHKSPFGKLTFPTFYKKICFELLGKFKSEKTL